jgi:hypothetical protein
MDFRLLGAQLTVEHRHNDGTWSRLERREHTSVDHDPERGWANAPIYQCTTCDEQIRFQVEPGASEEHR